MMEKCEKNFMQMLNIKSGPESITEHTERRERRERKKEKKHDVKSPCIELCNPHFSGSEYEEAYQTFIILELKCVQVFCERVQNTLNEVFTNHFSSHRKLFLVVKHIHTGTCCYPSLNNI